jgi:hypothetical protein
VPNGDVTAFRAALTRLIDDDEMRGRLSEAARAGARVYEIDRIGGRWQRLIDTLVTRKTAGLGASRGRSAH